MLGITLSKKAAPAPSSCQPGTRRSIAAPVDQQWALRMQQVLAFETDLLEYGDIFDGSPVIAAKVKRWWTAPPRNGPGPGAGGMVQAIESG